MHEETFRGRADIVIDSRHPLPNGGTLSVGRVTFRDTTDPQEIRRRLLQSGAELEQDISAWRRNTLPDMPGEPEAS